jgi:hypothetical protein
MSGRQPKMLRLLRGMRGKLNLQVAFLVLVIAIGVGIRLAMISWGATSPYQPVDVYDADAQSAQLILNLQNPYVHIYVFNSYQQDFFAYLPMVPVFYAPFSLLGDVRYGSIFADVLIMVAVYSIAQSLKKGFAVFAPLLFAILPMSIWLTSVAGTNMMVGTAFFALSLATLLKEKYGIAALCLGLGMASNQIVVVLLPLFGYYFWNKGKTVHIAGALSVAAAIILPFLVANPSKFAYGVFMFQLDRPLQLNGPFSLYSIVGSALGIQLSFWVRAGLFLAFTIASLLAVRRKLWLFVPLSGVLVFLGAFVIPVNGFWNYFLPAVTVVAALVPAAHGLLEDATGIHWFRKKSSPPST